MVLSTDDNQFHPTALNQGWWARHYRNVDANDNYIVGRIGTEYRNFFTFDLSGIRGHVLSAQLRIPGGTVRGHVAETVTFYDVTTAAVVVNHNTRPNPAIFRDLGSGVVYGSVSVPTTTYRYFKEARVTLNRAAIRALNRASGFFTIGGALTSLGTGRKAEYLFGRTQTNPVALVLKVTHAPGS